MLRLQVAITSPDIGNGDALRSDPILNRAVGLPQPSPVLVANTRSCSIPDNAQTHHARTENGGACPLITTPAS